MLQATKPNIFAFECKVEKIERLTEHTDRVYCEGMTNSHDKVKIMFEMKNMKEEHDQNPLSVGQRLQYIVTDQIQARSAQLCREYGNSPGFISFVNDSTSVPFIDDFEMCLYGVSFPGPSPKEDDKQYKKICLYDKWATAGLLMWIDHSSLDLANAYPSGTDVFALLEW